MQSSTWARSTIVFFGLAFISGCASNPPTADEYRTAIKGHPGLITTKMEEFTINKPFKKLMAVVGPRFESCFTKETAGRMAASSRSTGDMIVPMQREGHVTMKGAGKAEMAYTSRGNFFALVDVEAQGNATKFTVMGVSAPPLARGIRSWADGDSSCPTEIETPLGAF